MPRRFGIKADAHRTIGPIRATLGERVVTAFERLMGLILAAVAVEMTITGLRLVKGTF